MAKELVIDIGNSRIKGGFFEENRLIDAFTSPCIPFPDDLLSRLLDEKKPAAIMISSVNSSPETALVKLLETKKLPFKILDFSQLKIVLEVDEPQALGHDRIANVYGAVKHFPLNDCIAIDIGTAVTVDFITKDGRYIGGMIYPGPGLSAKALADYTDKLPLVAIHRPLSALGKTTQTHIQSGIYYGLLGALERLIAELRASDESPSSVKVIATGGITQTDTGFIEDLQELVDLIDPHLTLVGLHEIQKELH